MSKRNAANKGLPQFDLKAARESRKLTQQEVAELLCTTQGTIARWEAEGSMPLLERRYWTLYWKGRPLPKARKSKRAAAVKPADASAHTG